MPPSLHPWAREIRVGRIKLKLLLLISKLAQESYMVDCTSHLSILKKKKLSPINSLRQSGRGED